MTEENEKNEEIEENTPKPSRKKRTTKKKATSSKDNIEKMREELRKELKEELLKEMKNEMSQQTELKNKQRKMELDLLESFNTTLKDSPDPWIVLTGHGPIEDQGLKIEMEWNDNFINYLKTQNITGADENQMIDNWLILFLHETVNARADEEGDLSEFE